MPTFNQNQRENIGFNFLKKTKTEILEREDDFIFKEMEICFLFYKLNFFAQFYLDNFPMHNFR